MIITMLAVLGKRYVSGDWMCQPLRMRGVEFIAQELDVPYPSK
jgi:hypothetical protein